MEREDNYLDWLRDEARVVGEECVENEESDAFYDHLPDDEDEDGDDWTERDERLASRECY